VFEVDVSAMSPERFRSVLTPESFDAFQHGIRKARELLDGRVVWNVNSTARGGGVAELLESLVAYSRGAGIDVRWLVIEGDPDFFTVTKRIHNHLHGAPGDGGALDEEARAVYERVLADNMASLGETVRRGDVAIVHDPQPAGLVGPLHASGLTVIWRCHVGLDRPNELARGAWEFLHRYVSAADAYVFSRESFAWDGLDRDRIVVICPSIDVFSPKNEDLDEATVLAVLGVSGVVAGGADPAAACFERLDGTPGRVSRRAQMFETRPLQADTPVVAQVSRWDALKDPLGVIRGFAEHVSAATGSHLLYAGPATSAVADDPEAERVLRDALAMRESLPEEPRSRVHLATLPMEDPAENAVIVNALQRHAAVVTQKSLAEGFGLTVAEAMWKARPVVASRIGGIQSQIVHGESGLLLDDPRDLEAFGAAVTALLLDPAWAAQLGQRGRERVRDQFTSPRSLLDYLLLIEKILEPAGVSAAV
jgi:trehalose synthase